MIKAIRPAANNSIEVIMMPPHPKTFDKAIGRIDDAIRETPPVMAYVVAWLPSLAFLHAMSVNVAPRIHSGISDTPTTVVRYIASKSD